MDIDLSSILSENLGGIHELSSEASNGDTDRRPCIGRVGARVASTDGAIGLAATPSDSVLCS